MIVEECGVLISIFAAGLSSVYGVRLPIRLQLDVLNQTILNIQMYRAAANAQVRTWLPISSLMVLNCV